MATNNYRNDLNSYSRTMAHPGDAWLHVTQHSTSEPVLVIDGRRSRRVDSCRGAHRYGEVLLRGPGPGRARRGARAGPGHGVHDDRGALQPDRDRAGDRAEAARCGDQRHLRRRRALAWGVVGRLVPAEELHATARKVAERLAAGPTQAYAEAKAALAAAYPLAEALDREGAAQARLGQTANHRGAVQAFLAKRKPEFTGR